MGGILENIVGILENAVKSFNNMEKDMNGILECMKNKESMEQEAEKDKKLLVAIGNKQDAYQKQVEYLLNEKNEEIVKRIEIITNYLTEEREKGEEINKLEDKIKDLEKKILDYKDAIKMEEYQFYKRLKQQKFEYLCGEMRIKISGYEEFVSSCSRKETITSIYGRMKIRIQEADDQRNQEEVDMLEELLNYCIKCHSRIKNYTLCRQNVEIGDEYNFVYHQKRETDKSSGKIQGIYLQGVQFQYNEQKTIFENCKAYVRLD